MYFCLVSLSQNHRFVGNTVLHFNEPTGGEASSDFSWESITPQESFEFVPCFTSFQCARLSVPLNWNATIEQRENGPRAAIAVIKLPAKVPVTDPRRQSERRAARIAVAPDRGAYDPLVGCPFRGRCPDVHEPCHVTRPAMRPAPHGGVVACHLYGADRVDDASLIMDGAGSVEGHV